MIEPRQQLVLDVTAGLNRMTRDTFFEGPCNAPALHDVLRASQWNGVPRVLSGTANVGKTHLAHIFATATGGLVLDADRLDEACVIRAAEYPGLVLENAHRMADAPEAQTLAFHLFNQSRDRHQPFLITGQGRVRDWGLSLPDLVSRLTACAQIGVTNPDQDTLRMVLIKLFADRQLAVPPKTVEYAVLRMERSFAAALRLVATLDDINLHENKRITTNVIRDILTDDTQD